MNLKPFIYSTILVSSITVAETQGIIHNITVIDGDTLKAEWTVPYPQLETIYLRINGIDAPELFHPKCQKEKELAIQAKNELENILKERIHYDILAWDKYGGRILINLFYNGQPISEYMVNKGLAIYYSGEKKTHDWCSP